MSNTGLRLRSPEKDCVLDALHLLTHVCKEPELAGFDDYVMDDELLCATTSHNFSASGSNMAHVLSIFMRIAQLVCLYVCICRVCFVVCACRACLPCVFVVCVCRACLSCVFVVCVLIRKRASLCVLRKTVSAHHGSDS
jgi:hypothetical protein